MINKTSEHKRLVRLMLNGTVAVLATFMGMGAVSMTEAHAVTEISVDMPETTPVHVNGKGADGLSIDEASVGDSKADAYPNKMTTNGYDHSIIKGDNTGTKVTTGFFLPGSVSKETAVSANGTLYPMNGAVEGMTTDSSNNLYILMKQPSSEDEYIMKFDASILTTLRSNPNILRQSQQYAQWKDNVKLVQNARAGKAGTNYKYQETVVKAVESVSGAKVTATSGLVTTPLQKWIAGGQISFSKLGLVPGNGTGSHGQGIVYDKKSGKIYVQVVGTTANKDINTLYSVSTDLKSDLTKFDFKTSTKTHLSAMTTDGTGNLYWETKWPSGGFYFYKGTVNKGEVTTITQLPVSFDTIFTNSTNQNMAYDSTTDRMYIIANSATLSFNWSNYLAACTAVSFGDKFGDSSLSYNVDQYKGTSEFEGMAFINGQNFVLAANPNQVLAAPV